LVTGKIYLPFVDSLSNHERKISPPTASVHPSTSSGRTEAVVQEWDVVYVPIASQNGGTRLMADGKILWWNQFHQKIDARLSSISNMIVHRGIP
jgi:hypothetical protein